MYIFKIYYSVSGANRRRSIELSLEAVTLRDAWAKALDWSMAFTRDDEILNSIQMIREATNDN